MVLPSEGQKPRAVRVHVKPRQRSVRLVAAAPPLVPGAVGVHRRHDGLCTKTDAQHPHGVFFGRVVEVGLHGAGLRHHVPRHRATRRHVVLHHAVPHLGDPSELLDARERVTPHSQPDEAEFLEHRREVGPVLIGLRLPVVHGAKRGPGQFDLGTRFQGHGAIAAAEGDDRAVGALAFRLPAMLVDQALEDGRDADRALVGQSLAVGANDRDPFGFGSDPPLLARLLGLVEQGQQVIHPSKGLVGFQQRVL